MSAPASQPCARLARSVFTVEDRERARRLLVRAADTDPRNVAGAFVGSSATGGDRWSDLDLALGVAAGVDLGDVLGDWTRDVTETLGGVVLFDLPAGPSIYRVFLLPGSLQVDLSLTPAAQFG